MSLRKVTINQCPWCQSEKSQPWGKPVRNFSSRICEECDLIFIDNPFSDDELKEYYSNYLGTVHQNNQTLNEQRQLMYKLEYDLVKPYIKGKKILDVGCSGGFFLNFFAKDNFDCNGVEFGSDAATEARKKHKVSLGIFPELDFNEKYDLIIFRGVIEHVRNPLDYLDKAIALTAEGGIVYITSTPDSSSISCDLFKENWNQHVPEAHLMHFNQKHFDDFFLGKGFINKCSEHLYESTPYAKPFQDILSMAKAIELEKNKESIDFKSPAFWGNMMSLIYEKK
jgi:SAM-dependent methyltransferase